MTINPTRPGSPSTFTNNQTSVKNRSNETIDPPSSQALQEISSKLDFNSQINLINSSASATSLSQRISPISSSQHHSTSNNLSADSRSGIPQYNTILSEHPNSYEVPGEGSCLFWATFLGHFLPTLNNNELTERKFSQFFQGKFPGSIEQFKSFISSYDGKKLTGNQEIRNFIVKYLRGAAANVMHAKAESYEPFNDTNLKFDQYLEHLRYDFNFWGGNAEIQALCDAFGLSICILSKQFKTANIFGENHENSNEMLILHHVPSAPRETQTDNHYRFLTKQLIQRPNAIVSGSLEKKLPYVPSFMKHTPPDEIPTPLTQILNDYPYPCQAPSNTDYLLWAFIFSVFNDLSNESLTTELFESIFPYGFCEIDEFINLLQNFNLTDKNQKTLAKSIIIHLKDQITENLNDQLRKLTTPEEKRIMNRQIELFNAGENFDLGLIIYSLSNEFEIPAVPAGKIGKR